MLSTPTYNRLTKSNLKEFVYQPLKEFEMVLLYLKLI
jgi:hypothetical protein